MSIRTLPLALAALALLTSVAAAADAANPKSHPHLLVNREDIPALRERVKQEPFASMLKALKEGEATYVHKGDLMGRPQPRMQASLYLLTGEKKYTDAAAKHVAEMINDKEVWRNPGSKGLSRAAGASTVALVYDMCGDAWDEDFRKEVSDALLQAAQGMMKSMGAGANNHIANNWQGVRYGASGMAALASDSPNARPVAEAAYKGMINHLKANLGDNGWNPEGIGYVTYPWTHIGPFVIAAEKNGLGDIRKDLPKSELALWITLLGTVNVPNENARGLRADLSDDHPNYNSGGTAAMAFWLATPQQKPAVRWMYDYLHAQQPNPTWDGAYGSSIYSILWYPSDLPPRNPAEVMGLTYVDKSHGVAVFRNRFQDEKDIVAVATATSRRPQGAHAGPDTNTIRIQGLGEFFVTGGGRTGDTAGQTNLFPGKPPARMQSGLGTLEEITFEKDGGGTARISGSCMGTKDHRRQFVVDYSGDSGTPAMFLNAEGSANGKLWRLNTPEFNTITTDGNTFTIKGPTTGATLKVTVLEPRTVKFRTGTVERGGGLGHAGFPYRGKKYGNNQYIEFDCDGRVAVVMTMQEKDAPKVDVQHYLHGTIARVGKAVVGYERQSGKMVRGAEAEKLDLPNRKEPLRPRGLTSRVVGDTAVQLAWTAEDLGAQELVVERRTGKNGAWSPIATLKADAVTYTDREAAPATEYQYRVTAGNAGGRSDAAEGELLRTWDEGYALFVEDFAAQGGGKAQSLGAWKALPADDDRGFALERGEGSPRGAAAEEGYMATGSVPIKQTKCLVLEGIRADFSGASGEIQFDIRDQAVTVFRVMLQLSDGTWVVSKQGEFASSRDAWKTLQFAVAGQQWHKADVAKRSRANDAISLTEAQLRDIRGVGIWCEWVINQKWAHVDQVHLRARSLKRE